MKWIPKDVDMFIQSQEYVDTAVLPLLPVSFDSDMKDAAAMAEFISLLTVQLERQFRGRLLLLPGYSYIKKARGDKAFSGLLEWENELLDKSFKHVFYVTSDSDWKKKEENLNGSLIWLPTLPLESMDEAQKASLIEGQAKQLLNLFVQSWRENEQQGI